MATTVKVICQECGKVFCVVSERAMTAKYCSMACRQPRFDKACAVCGKTYTVNRSRKDSKFCSVECFHKGQVGTPRASGEKHYKWKAENEVICEKCGKPFRNWHKKRSVKYCSLRCKASSQSRENHPNWKGGESPYYGPGWDTQRRLARRRDGYKCQRCGMSQKDNGRALDVHHIKPFRTFGYIPGENDNYLQANELDNLICYCKVCHTAVEWEAKRAS